MNELITPRRVRFISIVTLFPFIILILLLFFLQVICGGKYDKLASNNSIRLVPLKAKRGLICDRNGEILADTVPALYAAFFPEESKNEKEIIKSLRDLNIINQEEFNTQIQSDRKNYFEPVKIKELTDKDLAVLAEHLLELQGVFIEQEPKRFYPYQTMAAHLLGYLGEINEKELKSSDYLGYKGGDLIGQTGIEKTFEKYLKGKDGGKQILVDARGRFVKVLGNKFPYSGNQVYLTIDKNIQKTAEEALGDESGAVIVSRPQTGEILALVSHPSFDPNIFVGLLSPQDLARLHRHPQSPFLNRVTQCTYPPGSIFKIITAAASLEKNVISSRTEFNCPGYYKLRDRIINCWKEEGHGTVNFLSGFEQSCNVYFFYLADKIDVDDLNFYGRQFGLGAITGIDLPYEQKGILPSRKWKKDTLNTDWYKGETLNLAIGQGYILTTPIQILNLMSAVANDGVIYQPQLVKKIMTPEGKLIKDFKPKQIKNINLQSQTWRLIKDGLRKVVNGQKGTGRGAHLQNVEVAGKTGTAQIIKKKTYEGKKLEDIPYRFRNHAWFAGFAPFSEPEVSIVIFVEHGGKGGTDAAPIARKILEQIFIENEEKQAETEF